MPQHCPFLWLYDKTLKKIGHEISENVFVCSFLTIKIPAECKRDVGILCCYAIQFCRAELNQKKLFLNNCHLVCSIPFKLWIDCLI